MATKRRTTEIAPEFGTADEENPEWTAEMIARAQPLAEILAERGMKPVGRPRAANPKLPVSLRLDAEIVEYFRAGGEGWQTRINAVLGEHVKRQSPAPRKRKRGG